MNPKNLRGGVAVLMLALASCEKKEDPAAIHAAAQPQSVELVKAAERSRNFAAVNRQLELGGAMYGYVDVEGDALQLASGLQRTLAQVAKTQPALRPLAAQDLKDIFGILGFTDIAAMGVSSVAEGNGFFRNRVFFYTPRGRHGLLAGLGGAPGPFTHLNLAPADTDVYVEAEMDLPVLYTTIRTVLAKVSGEPASKQLDTVLGQAGEKAALSVLNLIYGLKGRSALVVRLDPQRNLTLPLPPSGLVVPSFSLLACVDGVGGVLEPMLAKSPELKRSDVGGRHIYAPKQPLPIPGIQPVFVVDGATFYVATSREFLDQCLAQKTGLADDAEFRATLAEVGSEGNGLTYVHPRFFQRIQQFESLNPRLPAETASALHLMLADVSLPAHPLISIRTNGADGVLIRSHWDRSLKKDLAMVSIYNPVTAGLMAAMAIPAFQKVRASSQQKAVLNNLRQLAAAADQFYLEQGVDHATYADLVGPGKYVKVLVPVAGEDYHQLIFKQNVILRVRLADGRVVEYGP